MTVHNQERDTQLADKLIVAFAEGLPGFEHCKSFALIEDEDNAPFGTLQSVDHEDVSFVIVDPFFFFKDYEFEMPEGIARELKLDTPQSLIVRAILTLKEELASSTMNLVAPIAINAEQQLGKQLILSNTPYTTQHKIFDADAER